MTTLKLARETWRLNSPVSHGKSQGEHTSLVSQDKSQNESDNALASLVRSWQKSRRMDKPCEPYQKSSQ